jgi:hypothetical protein
MAPPRSAPGLARFLDALDRRWVFLFVAVGTIVPILFPIGLPVSVTPPVRGLFEKIESLGPDDAVLISFDYGPTTKPENSPMAAAVLRHCLSRRVKVVIVALYPIGGAAMAADVLGRVASEFPDLAYGTDFVSLGYKDGAQALMKRMGTDIHAAYPTDVRGRPLSELPLMGSIRNYGDIELIVSFATGVIADWWVNLINAQFGTPVAVGCTAVSAPKFYAYLDSGQMIGLLGGLKGASEYEHLLTEAYPATRPVYADRMAFNATRGMDVQTIIHLVIIAFIVIGNVAFFLGRRPAGGARAGSAPRTAP